MASTGAVASQTRRVSNPGNDGDSEIPSGQLSVWDVLPRGANNLGSVDPNVEHFPHVAYFSLEPQRAPRTNYLGYWSPSGYDISVLGGLGFFLNHDGRCSCLMSATGTSHPT